MNYKVIDREKYYRKGVFRHFSEDCKCSTSMTARIDICYDVINQSLFVGIGIQENIQKIVHLWG